MKTRWFTPVYNRGIKAGGFNAPLDATLFYNGSRPTSQMKFDEEVLNAYELGFQMVFRRW